MSSSRANSADRYRYHPLAPSSCPTPAKPTTSISTKHPSCSRRWALAVRWIQLRRQLRLDLGARLCTAARWRADHLFLHQTPGKSLKTPLLRFYPFKARARFTIGLIIGMIINAALLFGGVLTPIFCRISAATAYSGPHSSCCQLILAAALNPVVGSLCDKIGAVRWAFSG